jgi:hypothetical protein
MILRPSDTVQQDLQALIHKAWGGKNIFKANFTRDIKTKKLIETWHLKGKQITRNLKPEQATVNCIFYIYSENWH